MSILTNPRGAVLAVLLLVAGCTGTKETAVVVERPEAPQEEEAMQPATEPQAPPEAPAVTVGRFDKGKMWTFDNPPLDYFAEAYDFRPDTSWFRRARLGALRIPNCSASFVSPDGLLLTNHHCAREHVVDVTRKGEDLLDDGFYAASVDDERKAEDMYAEQLIKIEDVTKQVHAAGRSSTGADRASAWQKKAQELEDQMTATVKSTDSTLSVQVIELYDGGKYSAYTFRRYDDVRLVLSPELQAGAFGGDPDNFTYPRYSVDFSFFRVYDDGKPLHTDNYFRWSTEGAHEGELVFVVGNPGSTSRLNTVSQLAFERDYALPYGLDVLKKRAGILQSYLDAQPDSADVGELRNTLLAIQNQIKANTGELKGLRDPALIARRAAAQHMLEQDIAGVDSLQKAYGDVFEQIREVQQSKQAMTSQMRAFTFFGAPITESHVLMRAFYGYIYAFYQQRDLKEQLPDVREAALDIDDWPPEVEKQYLAARLRNLQAYLGASHPAVTSILSGRTPEEAAAQIVEQTALTDSAKYVKLLDDGYMASGDATVPLAENLTPLYFAIQQQIDGFNKREEELNAELALARFALHGATIPPDATFSLRIADGIVKGYPYNGTNAPPFTTFYGMYNDYYGHPKDRDEWALPQRWTNPPASFDLSTPINLVSTNDITGGNSGSPLLNRNLELVGLVFDGNIESLPNTYLYRDEQARTVAVDARGILEALDDIYDADRIVQELKEGHLVATEAEADGQQ